MINATSVLTIVPFSYNETWYANVLAEYRPHGFSFRYVVITDRRVDENCLKKYVLVMFVRFSFRATNAVETRVVS